MGESAIEDEARHHQQFPGVNVAAVEGKLLLLSGEICFGVRGVATNTQQRKKLFAGTEVSRRHSTDRGRKPRQEGLNSKSHDDMTMLGSHAATAVNSLLRAGWKK